MQVGSYFWVWHTRRCHEQKLHFGYGGSCQAPWRPILRVWRAQTTRMEIIGCGFNIRTTNDTLGCNCLVGARNCQFIWVCAGTIKAPMNINLFGYGVMQTSWSDYFWVCLAKRHELLFFSPAVATITNCANAHHYESHMEQIIIPGCDQINPNIANEN